jgi:hypothetical protein
VLHSNLCNYVFNDIASTIQVRPILAVQLALKFEAVFRRRPRHILQCLPRLRRQQPVLHRARGDVPRGRGCCVMYINHTTLSVAYRERERERERERQREIVAVVKNEWLFPTCTYVVYVFAPAHVRRKLLRLDHSVNLFRTTPQNDPGCCHWHVFLV